jgi:hypothetical protein
VARACDVAVSEVIRAHRRMLRLERAERAAARRWKAPSGKPLESCSDLFASMADDRRVTPVRTRGNKPRYQA